MTFPELRKGTASRKFGIHPAPRPSHRRGSAFSILSGFPPVTEEELGAGSEESASQVTAKSLYSVASSTSASSLVSSHYALDRGFGGMPASSQRKHKSSGSPPKGHGAKKHKVQAC
ncbi:hypothetical protein ACHAQA_008496 [Verticillium albo-atrum]